jgi:uroporphyrinogen decarboxylase
LSSSHVSFSGLRVAALESRRADDMARLIERLGGRALVSPSMREVPLAHNRAAVEFAHRLMAGQIDVIVFLTGVGARMLLEQVERHVNRETLLGAIADIQSVVRGPKPLAVLKEWGIEPTLRVPEPNTWRELLAALDAHMPVANLVVGLQEYGVSNPSLIAGLEARGATVDAVKVYQWALPEDTAPLEENVRRIVAGDVEVLMFTSGNQIRNLIAVAGRMGLEAELRSAIRNVVVASIGPTTSESLTKLQLPVDLEPSHPKMGHLVQETAERAAEILARKHTIAKTLSAAPSLSEPTSGWVGAGEPWYDSPFMKACRLEKAPFTPIWLMRQAGRYMPEYREVRGNVSFLELCKNPQLASEVMCVAVERLGVDAAIIFSDLLPILEPMGMELEFTPAEGPVIHNPVREATDVDRVADLESTDALHFVIETVRQTRADLPAKIPVIGFAGAPFTLASYAIEGGASRSYLYTKTLMYRDEGAWRELMERLARAVTLYLNAQIAAGAQAVQLFDSWVGCLGPDDYVRYVQPFVRQVFSNLTRGVPAIHFGTGNPELLPHMAAAGGHLIGLDWRIRLDDGWRRVGYDRAVQGNLDPLALLAPREQLRQRAKDVLDQAAGRPGHIFNLGHGVLPQTPPDQARALVEMVHEMSGRS